MTQKEILLEFSELKARVTALEVAYGKSARPSNTDGELQASREVCEPSAWDLAAAATKESTLKMTAALQAPREAYQPSAWELLRLQSEAQIKEARQAAGFILDDLASYRPSNRAQWENMYPWLKDNRSP